jgi:hypothetical protein
LRIRSTTHSSLVAILILPGATTLLPRHLYTW